MSMAVDQFSRHTSLSTPEQIRDAVACKFLVVVRAVPVGCETSAAKDVWTAAERAGVHLLLFSETVDARILAADSERPADHSNLDESTTEPTNEPIVTMEKPLAGDVALSTAENETGPCAVSANEQSTIVVEPLPSLTERAEAVRLLMKAHSRHCSNRLAPHELAWLRTLRTAHPTAFAAWDEYATRLRALVHERRRRSQPRVTRG